MLKRIAIAGALGQPFGTFPALSQSNDGVTWDAPSLPYQGRGPAISSLAEGGNTVIAGTTIGEILVTSDMTTFLRNVISDGVDVIAIGYAGSTWIAAANRVNAANYGPYPRGSETSQIFRTSDPLDSWEMVWSNPSPTSRAYQMKYFDQAPVSPGVVLPAWVMVGYAENSGEIWYSLDNGFTWTQAFVPSGIGRIMSVGLAEFDGNRWYWGCNGSMYRSDSLSDTSWSAISISSSSDIVDIAGGSGWLLAAGQDRAYYTTNGTIMESISSEGYQFDRAAVLENDGGLQKILFARSQLNQYTQWTLYDGTGWVPSNNNIHTSGSTLLV